jgi:hypothetical protein
MFTNVKENTRYRIKVFYNIHTIWNNHESENVGTNGRILSKGILKEHVGWVCPGFMWPRAVKSIRP